MDKENQYLRQYPDLMAGKKIMYVHGFGSSAQSGTVTMLQTLLPNATVKIFLTASAEARAQRRAKELAEKGQPADFATVLADIRQRDYQDSHRAVAPLKQADDAILVDTSSIGLQESFDLLKRTILAHI